MCRRIFQGLLVAVAVLSVLAVFVPWTHLFLMSNETATRCLLVRMLALPVFALCLLGATWLAQHAQHSHRSRREAGRF